MMPDTGVSVRDIMLLCLLGCHICNAAKVISSFRDLQKWQYGSRNTCHVEFALSVHFEMLITLFHEVNFSINSQMSSQKLAFL